MPGVLRNLVPLLSFRVKMLGTNELPKNLPNIYSLKSFIRFIFKKKKITENNVSTIRRLSQNKYIGTFRKNKLKMLIIE